MSKVCNKLGEDDFQMVNRVDTQEIRGTEAQITSFIASYRAKSQTETDKFNAEVAAGQAALDQRLLNIETTAQEYEAALNEAKTA